jgi:hypothetical protein
MGNAHQISNRSRSSVSTSENNNVGTVIRTKHIREHKRYGTVIVKITNMAANRRPQDNIITHIITPKGSILYGSLCNPANIQKGNNTTAFRWHLEYLPFILFLQL